MGSGRTSTVSGAALLTAACMQGNLLGYMYTHPLFEFSVGEVHWPVGEGWKEGLLSRAISSCSHSIEHNGNLQPRR